MAMTIEKIEIELEIFCGGLKQLYSDNLVSVVLYGSFGKGSFIPKASDVNLLVVLKNMEFEDLSRAVKIFNKWKKIGLATPLLFTEDYIKRSVDVFPIEFSDMKNGYRILYGADVLKDISIDPENLRHACERELKEKLLKLKQAYIETMARPSALQVVMLNSFSSMMAILRNFLRLYGIAPTDGMESLIRALSEKTGLSEDVAITIFKLKKKETRLGPREIENLYYRWVAEIEKIVLVADKALPSGDGKACPVDKAYPVDRVSF